VVISAHTLRRDRLVSLVFTFRIPAVIYARERGVCTWNERISLFQPLSQPTPTEMWRCVHWRMGGVGHNIRQLDDHNQQVTDKWRHHCERALPEVFHEQGSSRVDLTLEREHSTFDYTRVSLLTGTRSSAHTHGVCAQQAARVPY
jgi:hypothetical protein